MVYHQPTITDDGPQGIAIEMMLDYREQTGRLVSEASIEAALFEVYAYQAYRTRLAVNDNADEVMAAVAGYHGVERHPASPAILDITVDGTQGATMPAGTILITQDRTAWETTEAITITSNGQGTGQARCQWDGPAGHEMLGTMHQLGPVTGITGITANRIATQGQDQEPLWEYLDRAREQLQFQSVVPRLPHEFAAFARRHAQVFAAKAINHYRADTGQSNRPGHITVYVTNKDGTTMDSGTISEITAMMNAATNRPLNVKVHIAQPARVPVSVNITTRPATPEVSDQVKALVTDWGHPNRWPWDDNKVTALDIARAIGTTLDGLEVDTITLNGRAEVTLASGSSPFAVPAFTVAVNGR